MRKRRKNIGTTDEIRFQVMTQAVLLGVTTEEYAEFQALFNGLMEDGNEHFDSKECADLFEGNRFCVK